MVALVGTKEACQILDVKAENFWYIRTRPGFPNPALTLACGTIWRKADIERYARQMTRLRVAA